MVFFLFSCEKENLEGDESEFVKHSPTTFRFIFKNEKGESLIYKNKIETYPISFRGDFKKLDKSEIKQYGDAYYYRGQKLKFDTINKCCYWNGSIYGFDNAQTYDTYVRVGDDIDTITIKFSTSSENCSGRHYCSDLHEMFYNGTKVYSDGTISKKLKRKYVDIVKYFVVKTNGNTEVIVE